jgi:hypothetical protein
MSDDSPVDHDTSAPDSPAPTAAVADDDQLKIRIPNPKVYMSQWKGQRGKPRCDYCRESNLKVSSTSDAFLPDQPSHHPFVHKSVTASSQGAIIALWARARNASIPLFQLPHIAVSLGMAASSTRVSTILTTVTARRCDRCRMEV